METSPCLWSLAPGFDPVHKSWDGEAILYDCFSGDTHVLDDLCIEMIQLLPKIAPCSERQVMEGVADALEIELDGDLELLIQQRLQALVRLNILQCRI